MTTLCKYVHIREMEFFYQVSLYFSGVTTILIPISENFLVFSEHAQEQISMEDIQINS